MRSAHKILVGKFKEKKILIGLLGFNRNIPLDLKEMVCERLDWKSPRVVNNRDDQHRHLCCHENLKSVKNSAGIVSGQVRWCCEGGNELSGSINRGNFFDQLSDCQLL